jgi:hypothetical protein
MSLSSRLKQSGQDNTCDDHQRKNSRSMLGARYCHSSCSLELIGALQGDDTWDVEFVDNLIDRLVANVTLLAEEPMP